jgi:hypothetical protein
MGFVVIGNTSKEINMNGVIIPSGTEILFGHENEGMWKDKSDAEFYLERLSHIEGLENLFVRVEKEAETLELMKYAKDIESGEAEEDVSCFATEVDILADENWVGDVWVCTQF